MNEIRIYKKIRQARMDAHISQIQMSKMLNISRQTYVDIENGIRVPRSDIIYQISIITNRNISYFFYENYEMGDINQIGVLLERLPDEKKQWYLKLLKKIIEIEID